MSRIMVCSFCRAQFDNDKENSATSCGHLFHKQCLDTWLQTHDDCPYCHTTGVTHMKIYTPLAPCKYSDADNEQAAELGRLRHQTAVREAECKRLERRLSELKEKYSVYPGGLSIRNFPSSVKSDPLREIIDIFNKLSIAVEQNCIHIFSCTEIEARKPLYQIFVRLDDVQTKIELIEKFPLLSNHENETLRNLELRDGLHTTSLIIEVNRTLRGKQGITEIRLLNNQVTLKISGEDDITEIVSEEQIGLLSQRLDTKINAVPQCVETRTTQPDNERTDET